MVTGVPSDGGPPAAFPQAPTTYRLTRFFTITKRPLRLTRVRIVTKWVRRTTLPLTLCVRTHGGGGQDANSGRRTRLRTRLLLPCTFIVRYFQPGWVKTTSRPPWRTLTLQVL